MSRADRVFALYPTIEKPLCQAVLGIEAQRWRAHVYNGRSDTDFEHCGNQAKYIIGGDCYCAKHAGQYALKILVEEMDNTNTHYPWRKVVKRWKDGKLKYVAQYWDKDGKFFTKDFDDMRQAIAWMAKKGTKNE